MSSLFDSGPAMGLVGAAIAAIAAYIGVRHTSSGQVSATSADKLWDAQEEFRKDIDRELQRLRERVNVLEAELQSREKEIFILKQRVFLLEQENAKLLNSP